MSASIHCLHKLLSYDDSLCSNSLCDPVDLLKHTVKSLPLYIDPP